MEKRSTELQHGYYDSLEKKDLGGKEETIDETAEAVLKEFAKKLPGDAKVLDAGTGAGVEASILDQAGIEVFPADLSNKMLNTAREYGLQMDPNAKHAEKLTQADIFKLPFADETFDAVLSKDVISLGGVEERQEIIEELKRVLKPNGKLLIMVEEIPETIIVVNGKVRRGAFEDLQAQLNEGDNIDMVKQVEIHETNLRKAFSKAGLTNIEGNTLQKETSRWISKRLVVVEGEKS